jgi:PAS domain S-box-containing protein
MTPAPDREFDSQEVARARLAAIIDSSDDVIVSKTLDGTITSWNPAAERLFGWTAADAIGRSIMLIVPDDRRAEEEGVLARIRGGERVDHFETVRRAKDGRLIDMSITVSPIKDASGRIVGASKVGRDIGERRRLEEQRARLLGREQEARRQAEGLNRAKDELLTTVSHELRTPLNSILGWARLVQSGNLDDSGHEQAINAIVRNAMVQTRLVEDLLDMSRIAAGRMRLDLESMELNAAVEAALETVRPAARAKNVALVATLDAALGSIEGAPDRLQQVVWNLLMNAVKFTPSGGRVDISTRRKSGTVDIVVSDTGRGIAANLLPHVFEPFLQGDDSRRDPKSGLGLGLALVRRLVELHGGTVVADSPGPDRGATFTVTLPLQASASTRKAPVEVASGRGDGHGSLEGSRVLLVDDDADFLELVAISLRRAGADVRAAASVAGALEVGSSWLPHALLTDLSMPGQDGFALIEAMRALLSEQRVHAAIIVITADGALETRARARRAGVDLFLTKPVDPVDLATVLAGVIRRTP